MSAPLGTLAELAARTGGRVVGDPSIAIERITAVDDADATAERAASLGGQVLVPPLDAPWVRMTVITDPQGATFTASKFVPENRDLGSHADTTRTAA